MSEFSISNHLVAGVFPDGLDFGELHEGWYSSSEWIIEQQVLGA